MTGLQEAFYIIAIIFMGIMFVLIIALVAAVFVIRSKVIRIQHTIDDKLHGVTHLAERGGEVAARAATRVVRGAKRALHKK